MSDLSPLPIRLAQTLGLTTTLILAGQTITLSTFVIPRLLESPTHLMLRQWTATYTAGKVAGPRLAIISTIAYFYLAYQSHLSSPLTSTSMLSKTASYAIAGILCFGIVPYTFIVIRPTNTKLLRKADETRSLGKMEEVMEVGVGKDENAHALVDWWGVLNLGRGALVVASGILGIWTALN